MHRTRLKRLKKVIKQQADSYRGVNMEAFLHLEQAAVCMEKAIIAETNRIIQVSPNPTPLTEILRS